MKTSCSFGIVLLVICIILGLASPHSAQELKGSGNLIDSGGDKVSYEAEESKDDKGKIDNKEQVKADRDKKLRELHAQRDAINARIEVLLAEPSPRGVTEVQEIDNRSSAAVELLNAETPSDNTTAAAGKSEPTHMWIPWADNAKDFKQHHLKLDVKAASKTYFIWQSKGRVRYSESGFVENGPAVPGYSEENGRRRIQINADGSFEFFRTT